MILINDIKLKYGSEISIVLLCCRIYFKKDNLATLQHFINDNNIEWDQVINLCGYHRIEPIAYGILSQVSIPHSKAAYIKQKRLYLVQHSFKLAIETERIINKLKQHNIDCNPYKGAAFCKQLYGDIISRESSDIDLIIAPKDFDKVIALMKEDDYTFENQDEYVYFKENIFGRKKGLNFNKFNDGCREFHVEFHWRISENVTSLNSDTNNLLFAATENLLIAKKSVSVLNIPNHYIAVFIHHAINDGFSVLRNLTDLCQIFYNKSINADLNYIHQSLLKYKLGKALEVFKFLAKDLFDVDLPFSSPNIYKISDTEKKFFIDNLLEKKMLGNHFKVQFYNKSILYLKQSRADKIRYLGSCLQLRFIPSAKDIRIFNLPKPLYFLYPIIKPFRSVFNRVSDKEEKEIAMRQK